MSRRRHVLATMVLAVLAVYAEASEFSDGTPVEYRRRAFWQNGRQLAPATLIRALEKCPACSADAAAAHKYLVRARLGMLPGMVVGLGAMIPGAVLRVTAAPYSTRSVIGYSLMAGGGVGFVVFAAVGSAGSSKRMRAALCRGVETYNAALAGGAKSAQSATVPAADGQSNSALSGKRVTIETTDGKIYNGVLTGATETYYKLDIRGTVQTIYRSVVKSVTPRD